MPFDAGRQYLQDYFKERAEKLRKGERLEWSTTKAGTLSDQLDKFKRDAEHGEWQGLHKQPQPDMHQLIGVSNRIAWLCGCARDIRMQFTAGKATTQRTSVDHQRFEVAFLEWKEKGLKRLKEINDERKKKL